MLAQQFTNGDLMEPIKMSLSHHGFQNEEPAWSIFRVPDLFTTIAQEIDPFTYTHLCSASRSYIKMGIFCFPAVYQIFCRQIGLEVREFPTILQYKADYKKYVQQMTAKARALSSQRDMFFVFSANDSHQKWQLKKCNAVNHLSNRTRFLPKNIKLINLIENKCISLNIDVLKELRMWFVASDILLIWNEIAQLMQIDGPSLIKLNTLPEYIKEASQFNAWCKNCTQFDNLKSLCFRNKRISVLPTEIGQFTGLKNLVLTNNVLPELPTEIGQLSRLERLQLANNKLTRLPTEIGLLTHLKGISLYHNHLKIFPSEIGQLTQLSALILSQNPFNELPDCLIQLSMLKLLLINEIGLKNIPPCIFELKQLEHLSMKNNNITVLPNDISKLPSLVILNLEDNQLTTLPTEICSLRNLRMLSLKGNMNYQCDADKPKTKKLFRSVKEQIGNTDKKLRLEEGIIDWEAMLQKKRWINSQLKIYLQLIQQGTLVRLNNEDLLPF